ncbi:ribosome biogenesis regulatory protein homolog [Venturia canescens]|uniref:ribosome biogenesis regulatory protein homolog n=1 Tax=Venturia canescens TaxID=32260 RepID=UPI001C9C2096|nr:ribosome biogenesis regulatory protein homolog [Venturia canescens]XP_043289947.1 ribosome biogenesis regulatory protein homolog [Venturia canescens]
MDIVNAVLENNEGINNSVRSTTVEKLVDLDIDEGTLLASDYNELDVAQLKSDADEYLKGLTRDNVQLLINKVWSLPTERVDEAVVAKLPKPKYIIPRSRTIPKPRPLTKWQQFAKDKGIRTKKKGRSKLQWDDELRKWVPTFGYQKVKAQEQKEWLVELGDDNNPKSESDPRTASSTAKQERTAKNELQRLRNLARAKNIKIPRVGLPSTEHFRDAKQIATAVTVARASTASVGKFQSRLPKEKDAKDIASEVPGIKKKRKAPPLNMADEKRRNTNLVEEVISKKSKKDLIRVDIPSAPSTSVERSKSAGGKKKRAGSDGKKGKGGGKKPKGGKGKRDLHTKVGGRKRRN